MKENRLGQLVVFSVFSIALCLIWGCSTMESRMNDTKTFTPKTKAEGRGIPYFLPLVKLQVTAIRGIGYTSELTGGTNATTGAAAFQTSTNVTYEVHVEQILLRDRQHFCLFEPDTSIWSHDQVQLITSNGLVQAIALTNDDQTLTALENLVSAAAKIYATVQSGGITAFAAKNVTETNVVIFDPMNTTERAKAEKNLEDFGVTLDFSDIDGNAPANVGTMTPSISKVNGIFYRPFIPYTISWKTKGTGDSQQTQGAVEVALPNAAPICHWDLDRAAFVKQGAAVSFVTGEPTVMALDKPSQAEAFSEFPLYIANQLVSLPSNIFQAKFDILSHKTQIATQDNALALAMIQDATNRANLDRILQFLQTNNPSHNTPPARTNAGVEQPLQQ